MEKVNTVTTFSTLAGFGALSLWALSALCACELEDIPTFQISGIVFTIAFLFHAVRLTRLDRWDSVMAQPRHVWLTGFAAVFVDQAAYVYSIKVIPPEQAEVIYYLWPILTLVFASVFFEEKRSFVPVISAFLGLAGIYILFTDGKGLGNINTENLYGYLFAFLAALSWVVYSLYARYMSDIPIEMNGMWCGLAALCSYILHLLLEPTVVPTLYQMGILLFMGLGILSLSLFLWSHGMKQGNFNLLNVLSYLTPLFSVLILILIGKTHFRTSLIVACQLIILGGMLCYLIDWAKKKFFPLEDEQPSE
ncbi:MAG: EamA family transporter [Chlamydiales bacterium]|nr:EamA family transporter [Chlamydiia bacterium]MCP5508499.1 EamA family transporter [Chlamydiales bacterium]